MGFLCILLPPVILGSLTIHYLVAGLQCTDGKVTPEGRELLHSTLLLFPLLCNVNLIRHMIHSLTLSSSQTLFYFYCFNFIIPPQVYPSQVRYTSE